MAGKSKALHILLPVELSSRLDDYCQTYKTSRSSAMTEAFEEYLQHRIGEYRVQIALRKIFDAKFSIPKQYSVPAFYSTLRLLAAKYPNESSRNFWGDAIYLSETNRTHQKVIEDITDELKVMLRR